MNHLTILGRVLTRSSSSVLISNSSSRSSIVPHFITSNHYIHISAVNMTKALVLGVYQAGGEQSTPNNQKSTPVFTESANHFDKLTDSKLKSLITEFGPNKKGQAKTFFNLHKDYPVVSVVGLGSNEAGYNEAEDLDEKRENIRSAISVGAHAVRDESGVDEIHFDPCADPEAVAEGANLGLWYFDELKSDKYKKKIVKTDVYQAAGVAGAKDGFERGVRLARAQNVCRRLGEMPANLMTPTIFSKSAQDLFKDFPNVKVHVHDRQWAESKKMFSFLSVSNGSAEPPKFLEIHYNNKPDSKPFVLVGKGICFDSGGISIKPSANMDQMRYDMGGAANVVSATFALASLGAKVNVIALAPLSENLPSGTATKPGDVVYAMNGKSIQVDNTDAEGRLVLADALCYAHEFQPQAILDIATLTGAMMVALGGAATGVFTSSSKLYEGLRQAGSHTGDRVWRMPLYSSYKPQVTDSQLADCLNISKKRPDGGSCTAAAFLKEFVECPQWAHLDMAGVMCNNDDVPYIGKGFTGRPVRTLVHFLVNFFKNN